jgi:hypothetical protein
MTFCVPAPIRRRRGNSRVIEFGTAKASASDSNPAASTHTDLHSQVNRLDSGVGSGHYDPPEQGRFDTLRRHRRLVIYRPENRFLGCGRDLLLP